MRFTVQVYQCPWQQPVYKHLSSCWEWKPNVVVLLLQAYTIFTHVCPHKKSCNVIHSYLAFVPVRQFLFFGTTYILYDDAISWFLCDHYTLFLNICVSQGSVAVQLRCGGIFSNLYLVQVFSITNFPRNVPVNFKKISQYLLKIWTKFAAYFFGPHCMYLICVLSCFSTTYTWCACMVR